MIAKVFFFFFFFFPRERMNQLRYVLLWLFFFLQQRLQGEDEERSFVSVNEPLATKMFVGRSAYRMDFSLYGLFAVGYFAVGNFLCKTFLVNKFSVSLHGYNVFQFFKYCSMFFLFCAVGNLIRSEG